MLDYSGRTDIVKLYMELQIYQMVQLDLLH